MAIGGSGRGGQGRDIRSGGAFVELFVRDSALHRGLNRARQAVSSFARTVTAVGGGIGAFGAGILGPIATAFQQVVSRDVELGRFADKMGVGVDKLSAFAFAAQTTGVSLEELKGHYENWAERVQQGALGTGEALASFQRLGLDPARLMTMDMVDQFIELSRAMQNVTNETERLGLLSKFGGDKFQWLNSLLKLGPQKIRDLMELAKAVGAVVTPEEAANALKVQAAWLLMTTSLKSAFLSIGAALLPHAEKLKEIAEKVVMIVAEVRKWVAENKSLVLTLTIVGGLATIFGSLVVALGLVGFGIAGIVAGLAAMLPFIVPVSLFLVGLTLAAAGFAVVLMDIERHTGILSKSFRQLSVQFDLWKSQWASIGEAMSAAFESNDASLAFKIALAGLELDFLRFKASFGAVWRDFTETLSDLFLGALRLIRRGFLKLVRDLGELAQFGGPLAAFAGISVEAWSRRLLQDEIADMQAQALRRAAGRDLDESAVKAAEEKLRRLQDQAFGGLMRHTAIDLAKAVIAGAVPGIGGAGGSISRPALGTFSNSNLQQFFTRPLPGQDIARQHLRVDEMALGEIKQVRQELERLNVGRLT